MYILILRYMCPHATAILVYVPSYYWSEPPDALSTYVAQRLLAYAYADVYIHALTYTALNARRSGQGVRYPQYRV